MEASENYQAALTVSESQTIAESVKEASTQQSSQKTDVDTEADSAYDSAKKETKQEVIPYGQDGEAEDHASFIRRMHEGSRRVKQIGNITYAFHALRVLEASNAATEARRELRRLGIKCFLHNGLEYNQNGYTYQDTGVAATLADGSVGLYGKSYGDGIEYAGHEAFHVWKHSTERDAYVETLRRNIDITSSVYGIEQADTVLREYFAGNVEALAKKEAKAQFQEELYAPVSGKIHSGANEAGLKTMFKDYAAVKTAWDDLIKKQAKDALYSSQETDRDFDGKSYAEIEEERQKLFQREREVNDNRRIREGTAQATEVSGADRGGHSDHSGTAQEAKSWKDLNPSDRKRIVEIVDSYIADSKNYEEFFDLLSHMVGRTADDISASLLKKAVRQISEKIFDDVTTMHSAIFENRWAIFGDSVSKLRKDIIETAQIDSNVDELYSSQETDLDGYKTNGFKDFDIVSAVYTIRNEKAKRGHDLVEIGNMPTLYRKLFGLSGKAYVSNEHLYQNMVSRTTAETEGRFNPDASADYHDLGEEKIITAIEQFQDPLVIMESLKDFKEPRLVAVLDEKGNDGENLIAVLELYAPLRPHGASQLRNHVLITIYEKNSLPGYIEETVDKDRVLYKKEGSRLTSQAGLQLAGEMSNETLKRNVARFNKKVKAYKEENKIYYSGHETDDISNRDLLANAFEGITKSSLEYEMIQQYKGRIRILNEYEEKLSKLNAEIRKLTFGAEGQRDTQKLKQLRSDQKQERAKALSCFLQV